MAATRRLLAACLAALTLGAPLDAARAGEPVVVELFTSQGCSSCPPADELLAELAGREDIVALSLHVDYWDYLGWRDVFARHEFTDRQMAYRDIAGQRSIYTPQMVIHGEGRVVGGHRTEVMAAIASAAVRPDLAKVTLTRKDGMVLADISAIAAFSGAAVVWAVGYHSNPTPVEVRRGENAGRMIAHRNVVKDWMKIGEFTSGAPVQLSVPIPQGADGIAVIVQHGRVGPVLGAAKMEF
ncbi:MAG: hypothetical protein ACJA1L_000341 [Paracoccaceae bacterium]|jgi:hypothetical protein